LFDVLNRNANNEIEVKDFFYFVDIKGCKAVPVPPINPKKNQFNFETDEGSLINWKRFIQTIDLEEELQKCGE
jgi:hypothetical protein